MSPIHTVILTQMRQRLAQTPLAENLAGWTNVQLAHRMFFNFRQNCGFRLTLFGNELLHRCFEHFEFTLDDGYHTGELLYLHAQAKLPYYISHQNLIVYDPQFAVRLRLAGSLTTMCEIDTID